ncbi:MAG: prenyltransferase [Candidatus Micrarchaeales archaeon]|jgi:1,4-dihydroxy-2-naphthoate octaprenyltransferase|uniref:UbiA prenyltransferase n=1 Tax=Candidatus Micrarchaeum acidiphilum ARMAN-2 TaxID=425595 RepID=C7DI63_MICA2|nr:MAG: UbiA prenyltransferase [Candidatus Micrarchaeum acidiphilum ARMAN-2]MCW6160886.1 prenyltransferase [Candidatus Micrarchaeales archaeon]
MLNVKKWMGILRFWSFIDAVVPITVGAALAGSRFNVLLYLLMVIGIVAATFFANVVNDIFGFRHGTDKKEDIAIASRMHPLVYGIATEKQLVTVSILLFLIASACGSYIVFLRGAYVALMIVAGALAAIFYTAGKHNIKSAGLGELLMFIIYGPMATVTAYLVVTGSFSYSALALSIPIGISVALVMLANNIRDIGADSKAGLSTFAVKIGKLMARRIFYSMLASIYVLVALFYLSGLVPLYSLVIFISMPYAIRMTGMLDAPDSAKRITYFVALLGSLLTVGVIL